MEGLIQQKMENKIKNLDIQVTKRNKILNEKKEFIQKMVAITKEIKILYNNHKNFSKIFRKEVKKHILNLEKLTKTKETEMEKIRKGHSDLKEILIKSFKPNFNQICFK